MAPCLVLSQDTRATTRSSESKAAIPQKAEITTDYCAEVRIAVVMSDTLEWFQDFLKASPKREEAETWWSERIRASRAGVDSVRSSSNATATATVLRMIDEFDSKIEKIFRDADSSDWRAKLEVLLAVNRAELIERATASLEKVASADPQRVDLRKILDAGEKRHPKTK